MDEMDEIWALYADDGAQSLDAMEDALERLRDESADGSSDIGALFRAVHTFKGNSRVLGLANVEGLAHLAEDLIGLVRDEGVEFSPEIGGMLTQTGDALRNMLDETTDTRADVDPAPTAALKGDLRALIGKLTGTPEAEPEPEATPEAKTEPEAETKAEPPVPSKKKPSKNATPKAADAAVAETPKEMDEPEGSVEDGFVADETEVDEPENAQPDLPTAKPAAGGIDASLAGLLDQLDGGDGADFDDFEEDDDDIFDDEPSEPTVAEPTDDPDQEEAETEQPSAPAVPVLAEVTDGKLATIDPAYRKIFADMVVETCDLLTAQVENWDDDESPVKTRRSVDGLRYAAEQMAFENWAAPLDSYLALTVQQPAETIELTKTLNALCEQDLGASSIKAPAEVEMPTDEGADFFVSMSALYPTIADLGLRMLDDTAPPTPEELGELGEKITALAGPLGFVRVEDAAAGIASAQTETAYRKAELALYEELVSIERSLPSTTFDLELVAPSKLLGAWCADHVFETLADLRSGLEQKTLDADGVWFADFESLMRRVHFACVNFDIGSASQLTMALIDLFSRTRSANQAPDVILLQMGRGFIDTMELVFDALVQGDKPDTSLIEKMFEDATNVCFVASGVVTARMIETRLGLPAEFHRVLSPESVKAADAAIDKGLNFYVLRADLNEDDALAQGFLECITSGVVEMITNVTVFLDQRTLFDFLVASSLDPDRMTEQLALLDPAASRLVLTHVLAVNPIETESTGEAAQDHIDTLTLSRGNDNIAILETVGAISASHALLEHELSDIASVDLLQEINTALRKAGIDDQDGKIRSVLRDQLEGHSTRLMEISEKGTQLAAELSLLQKESVAQRSIPAEAFLRPFKAYIAAQSVKRGQEATLTYVGGEIAMDQLLIEEFRQLLKSLCALRLAASHPPTRFHLSIAVESDHVRVEMSDNSPTPSTPAELKDIEAEVHRKKGSLRCVTLPASAGVRFHLKLPQKMIVLDGMVVRNGDVRYVLPVDAILRILQADQVMSVAAQGGALMLKLNDGALVPIRSLVPESVPSVSEKHLFVIMRSGEECLAIPVDELLGQQLVMLRSLEGVLSSVRDMSGIAILSGGEVGMVVSVSSLVSGHQDVA